MKNHRLRGVLLGVSLALLLAGGVALAQGTATADKDCVECIPSNYWNTPSDQIPYDPYGVTITGAGWGPGAKILHELRWPNGVEWNAGLTADQNGGFIWVPGGLGFWCECPDVGPVSGYGTAVSAVGGTECAETLGEMEFYFDDIFTDQEASAYVLLAEVCEAEFVPEPGSMLLLGSGLMGLAGYAVLRWRVCP